MLPAVCSGAGGAGGADAEHGADLDIMYAEVIGHSEPISMETKNVEGGFFFKDNLTKDRILVTVILCNTSKTLVHFDEIWLPLWGKFTSI